MKRKERKNLYETRRERTKGKIERRKQKEEKKKERK